MSYVEPSDRRVSPRFKLQNPVTCDGIPATGVNISQSGIRLITSRPLTAGSKTQIHLKVPGADLELAGETVWSEPVGSGSVVGATFLAGSDFHGLADYLDVVSRYQ